MASYALILINSDEPFKEDYVYTKEEVCTMVNVKNIESYFVSEKPELLKKHTYIILNKNNHSS